MLRIERMRAALTQGLLPGSLDIRDDSARHAGHVGASPLGETHYHIRVTSPKFQGLSRPERHRLVYSLLAAEFATGLHALSLETPDA